MSRLFGEKINKLKRSYTEYLVEHAGTASLVSFLRSQTKRGSRLKISIEWFYVLFL